MRGKRIFDIIVSGLGLVLLSPLLAGVSLLVKLTSQGPVLYKQIRVGKDERPFTLYKFRTMRQGADRDGPLVTSADDARITRVGLFLRRTKLDELPQLVNVLKGDMSLVGPRPEVPRYVRFYTEEQKRVFAVRPGITDRATIYFRDEERLLAQAEDREAFYVGEILPVKLKMNLEYLEEASFLTDVKIILQTLWRIVRR